MGPSLLSGSVQVPIISDASSKDDHGHLASFLGGGHHSPQIPGRTAFPRSTAGPHSPIQGAGEGGRADCWPGKGQKVVSIRVGTACRQGREGHQETQGAACRWDKVGHQESRGGETAGKQGREGHQETRVGAACRQGRERHLGRLVVEGGTPARQNQIIMSPPTLLGKNDFLRSCFRWGAGAHMC